jgi:hypothetical protein
MQDKELRDKLIALGAIAVIVWGATLAAYSQQPSAVSSEHETQKGSERWLTIFTGLLVVVTVGLVWVGEMQRRQLKSAAAHMTTIERPYVFVSRLELKKVSTEFSRAHFRLGLTNHGRTPAIMRAIVWEFELFNPETGHTDKSEPQKIILSNVLAPEKPWDGTTIDLLDTELWGDKIEDVERQALRLIVRITISYSDVFKRQHDDADAYLFYPQMPGLNFVRLADVAGVRKE